MQVVVPAMFIATVVGTQTLLWHGQRLEFFYSQECLDVMVDGDKVQAIFVPETQQVWVIGKIE